MFVIELQLLAMAGLTLGGECRVCHELLRVVSVEFVPGAVGLACRVAVLVSVLRFYLQFNSRFVQRRLASAIRLRSVSDAI